MVEKQIRVLIADDHHLVRKHVQALLNKEKDIVVVATASDGAETVRLAEELVPDIVIMDITMPKLDGIQSVQQIQTLDLPTRVIMLSMHTHKQVVAQALRSGASGYVPKKSVVQDLVTAVRAVNQGSTFISPALETLSP
ncbi:MAG: response regulator transcription factor [Anaerolineales bacterium]|nr:response regulator transcription factor [Anaerolineales bacterium]MCB9431079.1 response regulator transcription factor [Ardenticatenaceae bacterium]